MYKIIGTRKARTFRVLWMLEEMGLAYEHDPTMPRGPGALAAHPSGKIPVMLDGDTVIPDSMAIMTYLADRHGKLTHPAGTLDRARQDALSFDLLAEVDAKLWCAAQHSFVLPEAKRVPAIKETMKWEYARQIERMSDALDGPFLAGDDLTIPDILLVHCLRWAQVAGFPDPGAKLQAYSERLAARPAFQRVLELP